MHEACRFAPAGTVRVQARPDRGVRNGQPSSFLHNRGNQLLAR